MSEDEIRRLARESFREIYGVSGEHRFAGFWIRVTAEGIDAVALGLITVVPTIALAFNVPDWALELVSFFVAMAYYTMRTFGGVDETFVSELRHVDGHRVNHRKRPE